MWRLPKLKAAPPTLAPLLLRLFSSPPAPPPPAEPPRFMADYLVTACGLSRAEAARASKYLAHVTSPEKPDAVLRLMRREGLGDAQIRRLVVVRPTVLVADVEKTLEPKIKALVCAGFSGPELARLISITGVAVPLRGVLRRVEFWRNLLGSNQNLLRALDRNSHLLSLRLEERVVPTLSFLRRLGASDERIGAIMRRSHCLVTSNVERIEARVEQVKSLGISPGSEMFVVALCNVSNLSKSTLHAKFELLRSYGWSQADLLVAFRRFPNFLNISKKKMRVIMEFLLEEAGCSASYVASRPVLLGLSLQRRLMPRFRVIQSMKEKGLPGADRDLYNVMLLPEKKFVDKYIAPHSEKAPEMLEAYLAATAAKNSSR